MPWEEAESLEQLEALFLNDESPYFELVLDSPSEEAGVEKTRERLKVLGEEGGYTEDVILSFVRRVRSLA